MSSVAAPAVRTLRRTRVASRRATSAGSLAPTYGVAFAITAADVAFVPLLPTLRDSLALSGAAAGVLLAATMGAMLVLAVPLGVLVDRIGARQLLALAGALVVVACAGLAMATTFATLLAARLLLGVAFAIVWTAAPARLATSPRPTQATGRLLAAGGVGALVAPAFGGFLAGAVGVHAPFAVLALVALPVAALLIADRGSDEAPHEPPRLRDAIAVTRRERPVRVAVVTIGLMGVLTGASSISAAFELDAHGLSSAGIGIVLSAGAVVWIVVAQLAGRLPERRLAPPIVATGTFVLAVTWLVPALAPTTAVIAAFVLVTCACRASLNTFVYRLARPRDGRGYGGVLGLMNVVYASCGMLAPIAAGALVTAGAGRALFGGVAVLALAIGLWVRRG